MEDLYLSMAWLVLLLSSWGQGNGQWACMHQYLSSRDGSMCVCVNTLDIMFRLIKRSAVQEFGKEARAFTSARSNAVWQLASLSAFPLDCGIVHIASF